MSPHNGDRARAGDATEHIPYRQKHQTRVPLLGLGLVLGLYACRNLVTSRRLILVPSRRLISAPRPRSTISTIERIERTIRSQGIGQSGHCLEHSVKFSDRNVDTNRAVYGFGLVRGRTFSGEEFERTMTVRRVVLEVVDDAKLRSFYTDTMQSLGCSVISAGVGLKCDAAGVQKVYVEYLAAGVPSISSLEVSGRFLKTYSHRFYTTVIFANVDDLCTFVCRVAPSLAHQIVSTMRPYLRFPHSSYVRRRNDRVDSVHLRIDRTFAMVKKPIQRMLALVNQSHSFVGWDGYMVSWINIQNKGKGVTITIYYYRNVAESRMSRRGSFTA